MPESTKGAISQQTSVQIRRATPADAEACGTICFNAFARLAAHHNFPNDFPSPEAAIGALGWMFSHPSVFSVVAEYEGTIIGSNCLDERTSIAGVGPITVDPAAQNRAAGRLLMHAAMARAAERKFAGVRLVQAGYHNRSLALYAKLGFVVREPLACLQGPAIQKPIAGYHVRPAQLEDIPACNDLCVRVHGHDRGGELQNGIQRGAAVVAEKDARIRAYSSGVGFFGHTVGEGNDDLFALLAATEQFAGSGILVPARNAALFRWCLQNGLRVVQTMTLMTMGLYNEPVGAYLPSVVF